MKKILFLLVALFATSTFNASAKVYVDEDLNDERRSSLKPACNGTQDSDDD